MKKICRPAVVAEYNKFMGGVDLIYMLTSLYKPTLCSRRWYLYIFRHLIHLTTCNSWILHGEEARIMKEPTIPLRDFIADLASCLCNIGIR